MRPQVHSYYPDRTAWDQHVMTDGAGPRHLPRQWSLDSALGQKIIELNVWAIRQGLGGAAADVLLGGLCRRLTGAGIPLLRVFAGMRTLHPQWGGYGYTWQRDTRSVAPQQFERGGGYEENIADSPFGRLIGRLHSGDAGGELWLDMRRRLSGSEARLDFAALRELAAAGATDYFARVTSFGAGGDASRGTGVGFSFVTDRPRGFDDDDLMLLQGVLPAACLAMMAYAGHTISAGLLATYLGADAGRRVHTGAVSRGSVESIRAVLWFADIRGFTSIADRAPSLDVIDMLDEVFEALTGPVRRRGGQVLKFLGDGMLAIFPIGDTTLHCACRGALDAAREAMHAIDELSVIRGELAKPSAVVDLALHLGDVLYGNVGAVDRLDFTVIGPAVNEAARIEALCEALGARVLVSAEIAAAADKAALKSLGKHHLRGLREPREIFALMLEPSA